MQVGEDSRLTVGRIAFGNRTGANEACCPLDIEDQRRIVLAAVRRYLSNVSFEDGKRFLTECQIGGDT